MSSITKTACLKGDKVFQTFEVTNTGTSTCFNTEAEFVVPNGLKLNYRATQNSKGDITPVYIKGVFNPVTEVWIIGNVKGGEVFTIDVEFEVTDADLFSSTDFIVEFKLTSSCEEDLSDNVTWLCINKSCPSEESDDCDGIKFSLK